MLFPRGCYRCSSQEIERLIWICLFRVGPCHSALGHYRLMSVPHLALNARDIRRYSVPPIPNRCCRAREFRELNFGIHLCACTHNSLEKSF